MGANGGAGNDYIVGNKRDNLLNGGEGDDTIFGHEGDDTITTGAGLDKVDGGDGIDTVLYSDVVYQGNSNISLRQAANIVIYNNTDTLTDIEYLQFNDVRVDAENFVVTPVLEVEDISVREGNLSNNIAQFTFNLSTPAPVDVVFDYSTEDIDAVAGSDYVATSGQITIPAGETSASLNLEVIGDDEDEGIELFGLKILGISGATFANNQTEYTPIAQTEDDFLYQSEYIGQDFNYSQAVPNGSYDVTLHFAEIFFNQSGKRVFDVTLEDQLVLDDFDIYAQTGGKDIALERTFNVDVTDELINLNFLSSVDLAKVSAIEIEPANSVTRTNAGGDEYTDLFDRQWQASIGFTGDRTFSNNNPIAQTESDFLYQSEHNGRDFSYSQAVTNGNYDVTLHFAEIYFNQSGKRVFDVTLEDQLVLDDFDILAQAGGKDIALERTFNVNVTDGSLDLDFLSSVNLAKISAIEISASDF
ncbi:MAG: malectin domain-containing carbohydrate-binding protein [Pleurocapsa sp. MO_226.B13]|nr:malectin domain-containing carbohydrate-binding protein [Pleurocapsa sp. MO_226.B13]